MRRRAGFTLIELMIVLGIIAILAVMAIGLMTKAAPRARLLADNSEVQQYLLKARSRAAQTRTVQKVCVYSDSDASDTTSGGRLIWMEWDDIDATKTPTTAPVTAVCTNEYAYASTGYTAANVVVGTGAPPTCSTADNKWCIREELDWSPTTHATANLGHPSDNVSILRFKDGISPVASPPFGAYLSALKALEITYGSVGTVVGYSSVTQGTIQVSNGDMCVVAGSVTCKAASGAGFSEVFDVSFVLGGAVRASEGL